MDFFGFHPLYVVILLAIALIIFGPSRLPKMGAQMGRMLREFQAAREGLTQQMREAFEEEPNFGSSSGPTVAVVNQEPASDTAASTETAVGVADRPLGETVASEILDRPAGESTVGESMPGEPEGTGAVAAEAAPGASTPEIDLSTVAAAKSPLPEVTSDEGQAAAAATVEPQGDGATPEDGSTPAASGLTSSETALGDPAAPPAILEGPPVTAAEEPERSVAVPEPPVQGVVPGGLATGGVVADSAAEDSGAEQSGTELGEHDTSVTEMPGAAAELPEAAGDPGTDPPPASGAIPFASVAAGHDAVAGSGQEESRPHE